jgi:hypothetical protein
VEDRDVHLALERLLDVEALGRLDVFEVDAAEGRLEKPDAADELVGILCRELDVEDVDVGEAAAPPGPPSAAGPARSSSLTTRPCS